MANFTGRFASPARAKGETLDAGPVTKQPRGGLQRGHDQLPHNIITRGLTRRVDTTRIP